MRLLDGQRQCQAHLAQGLAGEQRLDVGTGIEVHPHVARQFVQPALPATVLGVFRQRLAVDEFRGERAELAGLPTQRPQLQEQPGTVQLRQTAQRFETFEQLLPGAIGTGIVLLLQNQIGFVNQHLGAFHVLHGRESQHRHAQQVLGFG